MTTKHQLGREAQELVRGANAFATDLYGRLATRPGNLFCSPFSVHGALVAVFLGARGSTAQAMRQALHLPAGSTELCPVLRELREKLQWAQPTHAEPHPSELLTAIGLWGDRRYPFEDSFVRAAREGLGAEPQLLDLTRPEDARGTVNAWVAERTRDHIRDIVPAGGVDERTRLLVASAIYFRQAWLEAFPKRATQPRAFHLAPDRAATVPMMSQELRTSYFDTPDFQALRLRYARGASMLILLPRRVDGLPELEGALTAGAVESWLARMEERTVDILLPRFRLTDGFGLNDTLGSLGMEEAFSARADFSGLRTGEPSWISDLRHKAFVIVDEKGTEAAGATWTALVKGLPPPAAPAVFHADHPFLFLIWDVFTGAIYFMGRVTDPR